MTSRSLYTIWNQQPERLDQHQSLSFAPHDSEVHKNKARRLLVPKKENLRAPRLDLR